ARVLERLTASKQTGSGVGARAPRPRGRREEDDDSDDAWEAGSSSSFAASSSDDGDGDFEGRGLEGRVRDWRGEFFDAAGESVATAERRRPLKARASTLDVDEDEDEEEMEAKSKRVSLQALLRGKMFSKKELGRCMRQRRGQLRVVLGAVLALFVVGFMLAGSLMLRPEVFPDERHLHRSD
ncbi:unnamed protein product, partial [Polarella glacialis]